MTGWEHDTPERRMPSAHYLLACAAPPWVMCAGIGWTLSALGVAPFWTLMAILFVPYSLWFTLFGGWRRVEDD